jgi:hypothetical protein
MRGLHTKVASFLFFQNTFNYNPAEAERCILDKLDTESKSGSVNTTARQVSYYLERESGCHVQYQTDSHTPFDTNMQAKIYGYRSSGKATNIELQQATWAGWIVSSSVGCGGLLLAP